MGNQRFCRTADIDAGRGGGSDGVSKNTPIDISPLTELITYV
jgi:hypothetical protein